MKKLVLLATAVLFALGLGLGAAVAKDAPVGPKPVTNFGKKGVVTFNHDTHKKDLKCVDCHHNEADGKYKCADCHKLEDEGKAVKSKDAAHKKDTGKCYKCHYDKENATHKLKCADCHAGGGE